MIKPTNLPEDTFKHFAVWLAALFLVALGAHLWVVDLYGSPLPLWDQWYEADSLFRPWAEGHLTWGDVFSAHSEHRILVTRLLDLSVIWLNGRWEPLLQMTVNAFIHAAFACGLAFGLWVFLGRKNGWLTCFLLLPFFALPYGGENAIWGFNSLWYLVSVFALAALVGLGLAKAGSRWWWCGLAAAILSLFTIASGPLAPMAAGGLVLLRIIKQRQLEKEKLISLAVCVFFAVLGLSLRTTAEYDRPLQAQAFMEFAAALVRNLTWPFFDAPEMACLIALPLVVLLVLYLRPGFPATRAAEFLLGLALWGGLQAITIAYGRANYGEGIPASRYMDVFNVFVIASVFATVLLSQSWTSPRFPGWAAVLLPLVFAAIILSGLCRISRIVVDYLLAPTRMSTLVAEERVQTFWATGEPRELLERPTVRPDPELVLRLVRNAKLQAILPAACLPPATPPVTGRFTAASQGLQRNATTILSCGLILFAGLCGYGLLRGTLGLTRGNPTGIIALLAVLAALGFVWSERSVHRNLIEYQMQRELAAHFKSVDNFKRAAIHEHKADALKQQGNSDGARRP